MSVVTEDRIRTLFAELLRVPPDTIRDETSPATLAAWDSIQHLMLVSGFEEELGLDLDPSDMGEMFTNFGTFKRIVMRSLSAG